ncbi:MAG TPA: pseudouridine synthase [Chitinispirillaceae bacterium]|nr:pseudouridine synthase [Chitinispirillaceae bacterium]
MDRIDKILANHGYTSRRGSELFLKTHRVTVKNIRIFDPSSKAEPSELLIDDQPVDHPGGIFILMNKPAGYVCSHDPSEGSLVFDLLPEQWMHRNPVPTTIGRLDKDTTGALLITDRMDLVHRLISPSQHVSKVYHVTVDSDIANSIIDTFKSGNLLLKGEKKSCLPAQLEILDSRNARVTLEEGKYHQVKRMFASQGYTVLTLHRESFGEWDVEGLNEGCWKDVFTQ